MRSGPVRVVLLLVVAALLFLLSRPIVFLSRAAYNDRPASNAVAAGFVDDASRLNATAVNAVIDVSADESIAVAQIRRAFDKARANHTKVSVAGFRHSMGGQTIMPHGIVLNMLPHNRIEIRNDVLHVQSGAVWRHVISALDRVGRAVEVMQSDSPFSVSADRCR